jgi:hypothetical protein
MNASRRQLWHQLRPIVALFMLDVLLSFAYAATPTNLTPIRGLFDVIQFLTMSATMYLALDWTIQSL